HVLQRMDLLDQKIFDSNHNERGMVMSQKTSNWKEDMMNELTDMETFLERENFPKKGRALFYLGGLIYKIGIEQYKKSHKKKPILDKIDYQGMSVKSIEQLYRDVVKKLKQYNAIYYSTEHMMYKFHEYAGNFDDDWDLSESKNVFFILAGYAYQVKFRKFDNVKTEEVLEDVETNEKGDDLDDEQ
ncbi:MAG: hypothetical protein IMW92_14220, partial [Bacillales bacterium]|nr:hypothetical protein [Bacillales bacterium]